METQSKDENDEDPEREVEAHEPPREATPVMKAKKAEEIINEEDNGDKEIETVEDKENILNMHIDVKESKAENEERKEVTG